VAYSSAGGDELTGCGGSPDPTSIPCEELGGGAVGENRALTPVMAGNGGVYTPFPS
jgi:hypothetical protein